MRTWWNNSLRISSRWLNCALLGGYPTETVSGRAWYDDWRVIVWVLDGLWGLVGEQDHCYNSWLIDVTHGDRRNE